MLGSYNPKSLNYTIFYVISQQFGTRGCQEHHQLQIEDLKFIHTPSGATIFVEWVEDLTKTTHLHMVYPRVLDQSVRSSATLVHSKSDQHLPTPLSIPTTTAKAACTCSGIIHPFYHCSIAFHTSV